MQVTGEANRAVYALPAYHGSLANLRRVSLGDDNVFGDNTPAQVRAQTLALTGGRRAAIVGPRRSG